jgi:glucuronate isomerase
VVLRQPPGDASLPRRRDGTAGLYNTAGFNDDTRAFASIPVRHDVWRRVACDWLAGMVIRGVIEEEDASNMTWEFAYGLAKRSYGLEQQSARSTR